MTNFSSKKLLAIGLGFLGISLILLSLYIVQYSIAYKNIFKTNQFIVSSPAPTSHEIENDFNIAISKISVNAPIVLNVDGDNEPQYLSALEKGVAHLNSSVFPGQPGNSFIFGHSSYYFYAPGLYKSVFAHLNDLEIGDEIIIKSTNNKYKYQIFEKKVVSPDNIEITKNIPDHPETLTLMTCTPTGTTLKRLIIQADRID